MRSSVKEIVSTNCCSTVTDSVLRQTDCSKYFLHLKCALFLFIYGQWIMSSLMSRLLCIIDCVQLKPRTNNWYVSYQVWCIHNNTSHKIEKTLRIREADTLRTNLWSTFMAEFLLLIEWIHALFRNNYHLKNEKQGWLRLFDFKEEVVRVAKMTPLDLS